MTAALRALRVPASPRMTSRDHRLLQTRAQRGDRGAVQGAERTATLEDAGQSVRVTDGQRARPVGRKGREMRASRGEPAAEIRTPFPDRRADARRARGPGPKLTVSRAEQPPGPAGSSERPQNRASESDRK